MFLWWEEQRLTLLSDFCVCDLLILTNLSKYWTRINIQGCRLLYFLQSIISSISNWSWISKGCCCFYLFKLLNVLFNVDLHIHFAFFAGSRNWTWKNWSMSSLFLIKLFRYSSENAWYNISNELWKGYWFPCWTIYLRASFFYLNKMDLVMVTALFGENIVIISHQCQFVHLEKLWLFSKLIFLFLIHISISNFKPFWSHLSVSSFSYVFLFKLTNFFFSSVVKAKTALYVIINYLK